MVGNFFLAPPTPSKAIQRPISVDKGSGPGGGGTDPAGHPIRMKKVLSKPKIGILSAERDPAHFPSPIFNIHIFSICPFHFSSTLPFSTPFSRPQLPLFLFPFNIFFCILLALLLFLLGCLSLISKKIIVQVQCHPTPNKKFHILPLSTFDFGTLTISKPWQTQNCHPLPAILFRPGLKLNFSRSEPQFWWPRL